MRNKLKQLMKKEEGFTLVELLAVIVILGIIVAIAIPAIGGVIDRAGSGANDAENALVEDAARLYYTTNREEVTFSGDTATVSVDDLRSDGYLDDRGAEDLNGSVTITRTGTYPKFNYEYKYSGTEPE